MSYPQSRTGRRPGITGHGNVPGTQQHQGPRPGGTRHPPITTEHIVVVAGL